MGSVWPYAVFVTCALLTAPLYVAIILLLIRHRKTTTFSTPFYWLIISQGSADLLYMSTYLFFGVFVYIAFNVEFSTLVKDKVAECSMKTLIFCLALRCLGVMFIALHRYIVVCRWSSKINMTLATSNPLYIIGTHWVLAAIVSCPVSIFTTIVFGPSFEKSVIASDSSFQVITIVSNLTVFGSFIVCVLCYVAILKKFWRKQTTITYTARKMKREVRLCIQVAMFVFAFFLLFAYYFTQLIFLITSEGQNYEIRTIHPIVSGLLSFVVPWTLLFFNRDVSALLKKTLKGGQLRPVRVLEPLFVGCLTFITQWSLMFFSAEVYSMFEMNALVIPMTVQSRCQQGSGSTMQLRSEGRNGSSLALIF